MKPSCNLQNEALKKNSKEELFMNTLAFDLQDAARPQVTQGLTKGGFRLLRDMGFQVLTEFSLSSSRRADLMGLNKAGQFLMAEVKSSVTDFKADKKWQSYLDYCDYFYFVVGEGFPVDILPANQGIIIATPYEGEILRMAKENKVNGSRRKAQTLRYALAAARRLEGVVDPDIAGNLS